LQLASLRICFQDRSKMPPGAWGRFTWKITVLDSELPLPCWSKSKLQLATASFRDLSKFHPRRPSTRLGAKGRRRGGVNFVLQPPGFQDSHAAATSSMPVWWQVKKSSRYYLPDITVTAPMTHGAQMDDGWWMHLEFSSHIPPHASAPRCWVCGIAEDRFGSGCWNIPRSLHLQSDCQGSLAKTRSSRSSPTARFAIKV